MSVLPAGKLDRIEFLEARLSLWSSNAASIGISAGDVTALNALVLSARGDYTAAINARDASKLATQQYNTSVGAMTIDASELIQRIRLHAESTANPNVYNLANIPPPAKPSPPGPPPAPTDVHHSCMPDGSVTLKWKGTLANSAFFKVFRKMTGETAFTSIGAVAAKSIIDDTVPAGTHQAVYYIVGQRGVEQGPPSEWYTVNFGVQGADGGESAGGLSLAA
jgi:hypothetical protein